MALQRVNPALAVAVGRMFHTHSSSNTVDTTLSGKIMQFLFFILIDKLPLHSRRDWSKEQHRVRVFNAMLVLMFIPQYSVHFRTGGI